MGRATGQTALKKLNSLKSYPILQPCSSCGTGDMLGEHGLDQLRRPSSTRSFDAMELAIIVAVQPHISVSRTRPDPAGMTHEECTVLAACTCSARACGAPCQVCHAGKSGGSPLVEAESIVAPQRVYSGSMSQYVLEPYGSGA